MHMNANRPNPPHAGPAEPSQLRGVKLRRRSRGGGPSDGDGATRGALPAVGGERLVLLRHAVDVVLALVGGALLLLGVQELVGQALGHRLLTTVAGEPNQ